MKARQLFFLFGGAVLMTLLMSTTCKKSNTDEEDQYPTAPYSPIIVAEGEKVMVDGVYYLNFGLTCTSDNLKVTTIQVTGPGGLNQTFDGGGQTFAANEMILLLWNFPYLEGKYAFTVTGLISGGTYSGTYVSKVTYWELIIP